MLVSNLTAKEARAEAVAAAVNQRILAKPVTLVVSTEDEVAAAKVRSWMTNRQFSFHPTLSKLLGASCKQGLLNTNRGTALVNVVFAMDEYRGPVDVLLTSDPESSFARNVGQKAARWIPLTENTIDTLVGGYLYTAIEYGVLARRAA